MIERSCGQVYKHAYVCACARWFFLFFLHSFLCRFFFFRSFHLFRSFVSFRSIHSFIPMYILIPFIPLAFLTKIFFFALWIIINHFFPSLLISITHAYTPQQQQQQQQQKAAILDPSISELPSVTHPPRILSSLSSLSNIPFFPVFLSSCYLLSFLSPPKKKHL